jgi:very-short-patch-repair endonuclease
VARRHNDGVTSDLPSALRELARLQHGVFSRRQAIRTGLAVDLIRSRVRRQAWLPLYPGVYTILTGPPGRSAWLWAAVLYSGPGALLSHETAAELHGLADAPSESIYVTIPGQRRVVPATGISIYRSARALETIQGRTYPPRTRIEETLLDLTQTAATFDDVCGWVTRAFARDLIDDARLRKAMSARPKLRWRPDLDELIAAAADGDHSVLEYRYDRDVERAHGLPKARRQVPFTGPGGRRGRRDRVYEGYALVVELDGRLAHPDENQWKDKARDNAALVAGMQTLRYSWTQVRRHPCEIATEVATVLSLQGWHGRPRACSVGCPAPRAFP